MQTTPLMLQRIVLIACTAAIVIGTTNQELPSFVITNDAHQHVIDLSAAAQWAADKNGKGLCIPFWTDPHTKVKDQINCKPLMNVKSHIASAILGTQMVHPLCCYEQKWLRGAGDTAGSCSSSSKKCVDKGLNCSKGPPLLLRGDALAASQTSVVVIFFHIPKTGGQSVLETIVCEKACRQFGSPSTDGFRMIEIRTAESYMATLSSLRDEPHLWVGKHFIEVHAAPLGFLGFVRIYSHPFHPNYKIPQSLLYFPSQFDVLICITYMYIMMRNVHVEFKVDIIPKLRAVRATIIFENNFTLFLQLSTSVIINKLLPI